MQNRYAKSRNEAKYPALWDGLWAAFNFGVAGGSNSLVRDLAPINKVTGHAGGPSDMTWSGSTTRKVRGSGGIGAYLGGSGTADYGSLSFSVASEYWNDGTIIFDLKLDSASPTTNDTGLCAITNASLADHYPWTDGSIYIHTLNTSRTAVANSGFDKSKRHILAVSVKSGSGAGGWRMFQGGKLLTTATAPATNSITPFSTITIGRSFGTTYHFKGYVYRLYMYGRTLTDQEICRFAPYDNDYDPFTVVPRFKTIVFPEQAAGGGVTVPKFMHHYKVRRTA